MQKEIIVNEAEKGGNKEVQLVTFSLQKEEYGVEVLKVREIIRMPKITQLPKSPEFIEGMINLRGTVIPVINLRKKFCMPETNFDNQTRIIVMDTQGKLTGFIVDGVSEVIRIHENDIQPTPTIMNNGSSECMIGIINRSKNITIILDLDMIFTNEEKTTINNL